MTMNYTRTDQLDQLEQLNKTLNKKILNFAGNNSSDKLEINKQYIRKNFPSWQYNGVIPFTEILLWCEEQFENNWIWNWETIYFKYEKDKLFFMMRWS